ncbi:MAG: cell division protein CrgA [bacterium]
MPESKRRKPKATGPTPSKRPNLKEKEESPRWYVAVMAGLMGVGVLFVLARFFLRTEEWVLIVGLVFITIGFIMTTNYR